MSIATELTRLSRSVSNLNTATGQIMNALEGKGVTVPADAQLEDVADLIGEIQVDFPSNLVLPEYFDKQYGEERTGNIQSGNVTYDSTCPLQITGGAPVWNNNQSNDLVYMSNKVKSVCQSNIFTIEFFAKVINYGSTNNTSPTCGFQGSGDYWHAVIAPKNTEQAKVSIWINDSDYAAGTINTSNWHHYEVDSDGSACTVFIDGVKTYRHSIESINTWFTIFSVYQNRSNLALCQVALWDNVKHTSDFTVDTNPIYYT